jgi:TIR domain
MLPFRAAYFSTSSKIPPGADFINVIEEHVSNCAALIALIGPMWADAKGVQKEPDFVSIEIATAMRRGIPVIPVLVGGAKPPAEVSLPPDLQPLKRLNAISISDEDWDSGCERLIQALARILGPPIKLRKTALIRRSLAIATAVVTALVVALVLWRSESGRGISSDSSEYLDLVVDGPWALALVAKPVGTDEYRENPTGMRFVDRQVELIEYRHGVEQQRASVARGFIAPTRDAIMTVDKAAVYIFLTFKANGHDYSMYGTVYHYNRSPLAGISAAPVFDGQNWGWYPTFQGTNVRHFSWVGSRWILNTTPAEPVAPSVAEAAHINAVLQHSDGVLRLRSLLEISGGSMEYRGGKNPWGQQAAADEGVATWLKSERSK